MDNILTDLSPSFLIIGYGNDLRGDDAVGQRVSDTVASWKLPNVQSLTIHQLTPEVTAILATVDVAVFVDAYHMSEKREGMAKIVKSSSLGHTSDPNYILALTQAIYGVVPQAWFVKIPGVNFEFGESLSPIAERGVELALQTINYLIQTMRTELCMKLK